MKIKEVRELETKDLAERIEAEVAKYNQMKLNHAITPLENPSQIKAARRDIARMKSELHQRELNNRVSLSATKWIKPLLLPPSSRRSTLFMVSLSRRRRSITHTMRRTSVTLVILCSLWKPVLCRRQRDGD